MLERREAFFQLAPAEAAVSQAFEDADAVGSSDEDVEVRVFVPIADDGGCRAEVGRRQLGPRGDLLKAPVAPVGPESNPIGGDRKEVEIAIEIEIARHDLQHLTQGIKCLTGWLLN